LEAGLQLHLPTYSRYPLPKLLQLSVDATRRGVQQIWVTDNLRNRNPFVVLAALASRVDAKLGTAIMVQYFHNPVGSASAIAAISELMNGNELSVGIGHGNSLTPNQVKCPKPVTMLRETALVLRSLLASESVDFAKYPTLCEYFNLVAGEGFRIESKPSTRITLLCGGNGPKSLMVGGQHMDGVLFGGSLLPALVSGRLAELFSIAQTAASKHDRPRLRRVAEVKLSVARDSTAAVEFARRQMSHWILQLRPRGYTDEQITSLGIDLGDLAALERAAITLSRSELPRYVTDAMVRAVFVAGDARACRARIGEIVEQLRAVGVDQVMFSEIGPDLDEGIALLSGQLLDVLN